MPSDELRAVARARKRRDRAEDDLRSAIATARAAGATLQAIADAAGTTRQWIHQLTEKGGPTP